MKKRYGVGLFFVLVIITICIALILWNRHIGEKPQIKKENNELVLGKTDKISGENDDNMKSEKLEEVTGEILTGYYLMENEGVVCIYYAKDKSLFFKSDINVSDLPFTLQKEIAIGKYFKSELEVYNFLESYSS